MSFKLPTYADVLSMGKEALEKAKAPIRANQARKQGELELLKLEEQIITLQNKVQEASTTTPINYTKLLDALDELALAERRVEQFRDVLAQLFPEVK